jgi:biopolymer transport protein ExbD
MPRVKASDRAQEEATVDMTPMIDVVFLLIIFFLCIDFRVLESKLPAYLPKDSGVQHTQTEPIEKLSVQIVCTEWGEEIKRRANAQPTKDKEGYEVKPAIRLEGHQIHWMVNSVKFHDLEKLKDKLVEIAQDPTKMQPDAKNPGKKKRMPVVIEPGVQTTYGDVARTVDAVTKAGFDDIQFGGGLGSRAEKAAAAR